MAEQTEGVDYVIAPQAVHDPELERNVYGAGDRVPMDDAVKYGLVAKPASRAKQGPAENRARKATRKAAKKA